MFVKLCMLTFPALSPVSSCHWLEFPVQEGGGNIPVNPKKKKIQSSITLNIQSNSEKKLNQVLLEKYIFFYFTKPKWILNVEMFVLWISIFIV